jgi:hypothetical protein
MKLINRWKLDIFRTQDLQDAREVVRSLHARGYKRVAFSDPVDGKQYKTYAKIDFVRKEAKKFYYVEFMSHGTQ